MRGICFKTLAVIIFSDFWKSKLVGAGGGGRVGWVGGGGGGCTVGQVTAWTTKTHVALAVGLPAAHIAQPGEICLGSRKDPVVWKHFVKTIKRVINYLTIYIHQDRN